MTDENICWAIVDLMGHVELSGRINKPGEYGGLWQIDIPDGDTFRTEFFGSQSVYRIRIVSESIARAYSNVSHDVIEYAAPIVTREEHENAMARARVEYRRAMDENDQLKQKLLAIRSLPAGNSDQKDDDFDDVR